MSVVKTAEEVEKMRVSGALLSKCLDTLVEMAVPGVTAKEIDTKAEEFIRDHGAVPAFKHYGPSHNPYPASICFSRNSVVVHGIPRHEEVLMEGDMVTIDCGLSLDGWFADAARLFGVGKMKPSDSNIIKATKEALSAGVSQCLAGNTLGDVSYAIHKSVNINKYHVVLEFCGHAIGRKMHEEPQVLNAGVPGKGLVLEPGMVFCLEPMLKKTKTPLGILPDKWTVATRDGTRATHIEDMVLITNSKPEILTA